MWTLASPFDVGAETKGIDPEGSSTGDPVFGAPPAPAGDVLVVELPAGGVGGGAGMVAKAV
jgi:hypothetical protein